ncbi:MAG TPA: AMP-binding protein [Burkholderiales bacterium]|nr:AMP-binding protein [Burkholderiales bacterium]
MIRGLADIEAIERIPLEQQNDAWTIPELLERGASLDPDKAALQYLSNGALDDAIETVTYRQLSTRVRQAAALFRSLGVTRGEPVAIMLPVVPQNFVALLGAVLAGIAFPVNWMLDAAHIGELVASSGARVAVALGPTPGYDIWEKAQKLSGRSLHLLDERDFDRLCGSRSPDDPTGALPDRDDIALYIHTGGTTSKPKIAKIPHRCIAYKAWAMSLLADLKPSQVTFGVGPLFHVGGIVLRTLTPLSRGQTIVVPGGAGFRNKNVIRDYWKLVERFRITDLVGVPTVLGALTNVPRGDADVSSLRRLATTGSAALSTSVADHFEKYFGIRILSDYGLTEATATAALPPRDGPRKDGSSGVRLPFTQIRTVVFGAGGRIERDCGVDEIGEIVLRGPGVIPGYLDPALDAALFVGDGWIRSGDLGRLDADGYLWVTGRVKDLIIRGGHNIDPRPIEETLQGHPAVELAAAVGKPDAYAGELPVAYVQLRPGHSATAAELKEFARARVSERAAAPVDLFVLDALPLTGVGKIAKQELRERALRHAMSELLRAELPAGIQGDVSTSVHPTHGTLVTVALAAKAGRDQAVEQRLRAALGRFAYAFDIVWSSFDRDLVRRFAVSDQSVPVRLRLSPFAAGMETTLLGVDMRQRRARLGFRPGLEYVAARDTLQGGALATMLDASMIFAVLAVIPEGKSAATTNLNISYLKPAFPGVYTAEAQVERLGRTTVFARAELVPEGGEPVASASGVFSVFDRLEGGS